MILYDILIKNYYKENGSLEKKETRLYSIPISLEDADNVLTDPSVSCDLGKTGTFEFTIHPNHPYYHAIAQMRTIMRVVYDGSTIFRGRILTIDNTLTGAKKIHCEGDMAFLLDSYQMATKEEERSSITLGQYITNILTEHNRQMSESGETDKCIYPGYIPGNYPRLFSAKQQITNSSAKFGSRSHEQTLNALETLTKEYGGFLRTRYNDDDGKVYLDWCKNWFREAMRGDQPIAITRNVINAQSNSEVDNIFTALIPIGKKEGNDVFINGYKTNIHGDNNRILVPQIARVYTAEQLDTGYMTEEVFERAVEQYGIIYKVQNFSNADTPEKLWSYACDWIRHNYVGGITNYDLTAVDMHHVDGKVTKYLVGDQIRLFLPNDMTALDEHAMNEGESDLGTTLTRTLLSVKYNLHNPDKNSYTAGISSDILNREYGTSSTSKSKGGGAGSKGGGSGNNQKKIGGDSEYTEQELNSIAYSYIVNAEYNNDLYQQLLQEDPTGVSAANAEKASHVSLVRDITGTEVLEDGSQRERNFGIARTLILDAQQAALNFMAPFVKVLGTDEQGQKITEMQTTTSLEINGYEGYLNFKKLPSYHDTPIGEGLEIIGKGVDVVGQVASAFLDPLNVLGFRATDKGASMKFSAFEDPESSVEKVTATVNGEEGIFGIVKAVVGSDGSGNLNLATIIQDGLGNDGTGSMTVGKSGGNWLIKLNEPLSYQDEHGTVHTLPNGVIDAKDYATLTSGLEVIPSFVTQMGVFKSLIAENVQAINLKADRADLNTLSAKVADIERLTSEFITADSLATSSITVAKLTVTRTVISVNGMDFSPKYYNNLGAASIVLAHG